MGLMDEIRQEIPKKGPRCSIRTAMEEMDPADAKELKLAFEDRSIPGTAIFRALKARGLEVSDHTLQRHRRKECSCRKDS